jgi:translation initiation factor 2B subunit (eIF-2B alpha/beta/delta family)
MDPRLQAIASAVASDAHSGASEMLTKAAGSILALPEDVYALPSSEWTAFGIELHRGKPSIATLFNLANVIMLEAEAGPEGVRGIRRAVEDLMERERRSVTEMARTAAEAIDADWIITTSYSSTVSAILGSIASRRSLRVTVAESFPGGEGRQFAHRLWDMGIESEIIPDSNVFARAARADCALTGADSLTPQGLVNKVGTRALVEAARCHDRPAYGACGQSKFSPVALTDMVVAESTASDGPSERSQVFESTPLERFTRIITEDGIFTPGGLEELLQGRRLASGWSSLAP